MVILENPQYQKVGIEIIDEVLNKDDDFQKDLEPIFFCHGKIGVTHMYNRLYQYTKNKKYKNAAFKWYNRIEYEKIVTSEKKYFPEIGLLLGYEGFLLSSLSITTDLNPSWDRCLLLS